MNKKVLLTSVLSLVLCFGLIAGSTFALFTSESNTNIAITSGNVEVDAQLTLESIHTPARLDNNGAETDATNIAVKADEYNGAFGLGGNVKIDGAEVSLTNMMPGDKVVLKVNMENKSNVAIMQRMTASCSDLDKTLFNALKMGVSEDNQEYTYYIDFVSAWESNVDVYGEGTTAARYISIELPGSVGEKAENKACNITVNVMAVQGNAETINDDSVIRYEVEELANENAASLQGAVGISGLTLTADSFANNSFNIGSRETLAQSRVDTIVLSGADITTGRTQGDADHVNAVISVNTPANSTVVLKDSTINGLFSVGVPSVEYPYVASNIADLVIENCVINGGYNGYPNAFKSITFRNCTFTNEGMDLENMYSANCFPVWLKCDSETVVNFDGCTFNTNRGIHIDGRNGANNVVLNVTDCTFNLTKSSASNDDDSKINAIKLLNGVKANVEGCRFNTCKYAFEIYSNTNVTVNQFNNTFGTGVEETWNR